VSYLIFKPIENTFHGMFC